MQFLLEFGLTVRRLWTDDRGHILFAIAAGWFLSLGVRLAYPVLLPHLQTAYGLNLTVIGLLLSVLWGAYALGQLPGGILSDRIGEGNILVVSTVIAAVTLALVSTAGSPIVLFAATALFGFGTALYGVARFTAMSQIFPENEGAAIGITMAAGDFGSAVLPPIAGLIAGALVWQYGFGFAIPLFGLVAILLWLVVPGRTSGMTSAVDSLSLETIQYILSEITQSTIITVAVIQLLGYAVWQAFTGFYPTYLIENKGLSSSVVTVLFGLFFALGVVIKPLAGRTYDRFGIRRSFPIVMGVFVIAVLLLPLANGFWVILALTIPLSSLLGYSAISLSYLTAAMPDDIQGTGLGVLRTVYMTIGAGSPVVVGVLADHGFFDEAFILLAVVAGVTILLCLYIPD